MRKLGLILGGVALSLCLLSLSPAKSEGQCFSHSYPVIRHHEPAVRIVKEVVVEREYVPIAVAVPFQAIIPVGGYSYGGAGYSLTPAMAPYPPPLGHTPLSAPPLKAPGSDCDAKIAELKAHFEKKMEELTGGPPRASGLPRSVPAGVSGDDIVEKAAWILKNNCASCHTGGSSKGGVTIFLADGRINPAVNKNKLVDASDKGRMPPKAREDVTHALTDDEVATLKAWAEAR